MANCYVQIRCGVGHKDMKIGREYNFSIGKKDTKIPPEELLDFWEIALEKAITEKYGDMYELE